MPHKRRKRSDREAASAALGYDNPPSASDSINAPPPPPPPPVASTSNPVDRKPVGVLAPDTFNSKHNKRRKKAVANGSRDAAAPAIGVSKNVHRILNAVTLREEYNAKKKRKLEEQDRRESGGGAGSKQKKQDLKPMPYESLSAFNRRVEQTLQPEIASAIRNSKASASKKAGKKTKAKADVASDDEGSDEFDDNEQATMTTKHGKTRARPTPSESRDPFVSHKRQKQHPDDDSDKPGKQKLAVPPPRRDGAPRMTDFAEPTQRRSVNDVVSAPPVLPKAGRKLRVAGMEDAIGHGRLPIGQALKDALDKERQRAIEQYRALKERKREEAS